MKLFRYLPLLLIFALGCGPAAVVDSGDDAIDDSMDNDQTDTKKDDSAMDGLEVNAANFVSGVSNPYFSIVPGRKFFYDGRTPTGVIIHKEVLGTERTRDVQGVTTQAIWEREWHDDLLVSDAKKWYAQDKDGNVWLFAEDEQEIFGGFARSEGESWEAGVGEARAGIVVPGQPKAGETIIREYNSYEEEKSELVSLDEAVSVPAGNMADCIKIRDYGIENNDEEDHAYYCRESGQLAQELIPDTFGKLTLTKTEDNFPTNGIDIKYPALSIVVTETEAKETALDAVVDSKEVSSLDLVLYDKKPAYLAEVTKDNGNIVKVWINITTGSVLGTAS